MMKRLLPILVGGLLMSTMALGQAQVDRNAKRLQEQQKIRTGGGYQCGNDPILPTDGSSTQDYIPPDPASNFYLVHLLAGHSYSVDMWDPVDLFIGGPGQIELLSSPGCTPLTTNDYVTVDPNLSGSFGDRISWLQVHDGDAVVEVNNLDTNGGYYAYIIRVTDTTLQNEYWTTNGGLATEYMFTNNTEFTLSGTLTLKDVTGGGTDYSVHFAVPGAQQTSKIVAATGIASSGLQVPANHTGRASFAFNGPAGAIIAQAFTISAVDVPITPLKFEAKFSPH